MGASEILAMTRGMCLVQPLDVTPGTWAQLRVFCLFFFFLRFEFSLQVYHLCFDGEKVYILRFVGNFIVLVFVTSQGECIRF